MRKTRTITPSEMRVINRSAVLDLVRRESPISRSGIAEKLEVSLPTVMRIIDDLIEEELVRPLGITEWSGGRRRSLLEFNARSQVMVGLDLSGVEIYGSAADLAGNMLFERSQPLNGACGDDAYHLISEVIEELINKVQDAGQRVRGIGVGVPGITDYSKGVVREAPALDWHGYPLRQKLIDRFKLPVIIDNDVNLAALGELWFGAGQNAENLVAISVGRGIGAGVVIDGAIYRGSHQSAGEVGYLLPGCEYLSQNHTTVGALESAAAMGAILNRGYRMYSAQGADGNEEVSLEQIFAAYRAEQNWAVQTVNETVDNLCIAIAAVSLCFDPDVVVLGGALTGYFDQMLEPIQARLRNVLPVEPKLVVSTLGHRASILGAITNVLHQTADFYMLRSMA